MQTATDDELFHNHLRCLANSTVRIVYCTYCDVLLCYRNLVIKMTVHCTSMLATLKVNRHWKLLVRNLFDLFLAHYVYCMCVCHLVNIMLWNCHQCYSFVSRYEV